MAQRRRVPVSRRALVQRINRKLRPQGETLKATRPGTRAEQDMGGFYVIDDSTRSLAVSNIDLEAFGREIDALAPHEELVDD